MTMKKDIEGAVFLFFVAVVTAFILNHVSPFGIAVYGQWQKSDGVVNAVSKAKDMNASIEINNPEMIKEIVWTKQRIILDVCLFDFYELGRLPGALSFPLADFETGINRLMEIANQNSFQGMRQNNYLQSDFYL